MRIIDNASVELVLDYDEPTLDSDLTPADLSDNPPLKDLAYTSLYYKVGNGAPVAAARINASAPTGGGHIVTPLVVPAPINQRTSIDFWVTSTDLSGNSQGETHTAFVVDRMAPLPPSNFTVA